MAQKERLLVFNNHGVLSLADLARTAVSRYTGSLYIPNDANCFQDSAGTTPATKDSVVGYLKDMVGTNHATQATTGYKPILRKGAVNLLRYSEDFSNAAWAKVNTTITANAATAPNGTLTADRVDIGANNDDRIVYGTTVALTSNVGVSYTFSFYARSISGTQTWKYRVWTGTSYSATQTVVLTEAWQRITYPYSATGGNMYLVLGTNLDGLGAMAAYIWGAQLETGSTASSYVATTSAPASNGIGPWWLDFDGADDVLSAGAFGAGFAASTLVRSNYGAVQTTTTAQDLSAGYNMTVDNSGLIVVPDTVSAADLAVLQRYANSLGGYSA